MCPARLVPKPALVNNAYRELSIKIGPIVACVAAAPFHRFGQENPDCFT